MQIKKKVLRIRETFNFSINVHFTITKLLICKNKNINVSIVMFLKHF